jgi:DNA/RNA-binding domain of Phe-tRNA-synthetase-like protein
MRSGSPAEAKMPSLSIAELTDRFPDFRVALVVAEDLSVGEARSAALQSEIEAIEAECRRRWSGVELSAIPGIAAWRAAYKGFGVKKTSYRSSVERLIKRVVAGGALPQVSALVDLYNAVSLDSGLCLGCDDLDAVEGDLAFRFSRTSDTFVDMGAEVGEDPNDPPKVGEVVYADSRHVLCRRWNWRQDARSAVSARTRRAALTVQSNGFGDVEAAADRIVALIERECQGHCRVVVADRGRATVAF